ncbi:MAG: hypothetical protein QOJ26_1470 [Thermoplasmata archaeon]|nr:hypothetical protein [Thermoplasmata archaeon]
MAAKRSKPILDYPAWQFFVAAGLCFSIAAVSALLAGFPDVAMLVVGVVSTGIGLSKCRPSRMGAPPDP